MGVRCLTKHEVVQSELTTQQTTSAEVGEPPQEPASTAQATRPTELTRAEPMVTVGLTRGVVHEVPASRVFRGGTVG